MWRRTWFLLFLIRVYFALQPSYLHPDENFQGPEVIAGRIFSYPVHLTWEFTSTKPIRSSFPLWLAYGFPMYLLRWLWEGFGYEEVSPSVVYWTLRVLMVLLSIVLEDWAVLELVQSPRRYRVALPLIASSYVTWTFQSHTFSNSLETLLVAWSLVLIGRIVEDKKRSAVFASSLLGFLVVVGVFNRITFPAFLVLPSFTLLPHFRRKPFSLVFLILFTALTAFIGISVDTAFYTTAPFSFSALFRHPVITTLNNLKYNSSVTNLAQHGIHPFYQHILINLPQLLGPAFPLLFFYSRLIPTVRLASAVSGIILLSLIPHQEARFLLPAVPLILSSIRLPRNFTRAWLSTWIIFNLIMGILMGVYHQGGIVPVQMYLAKEDANVTHALWWKTYSPPIWLLNGKNEHLTTLDLMGMPGPSMLDELKSITSCEHRNSIKSPSGSNELVYLVAPRSAHFLHPYTDPDSETEIKLEEIWSYRWHLNLDDLDFGDDGVWPTLKRVVGDRGLVVWRVRNQCSAKQGS
ncbi:glycosyltransferase family 22 protein [Lepidopterella palustris CBS 459.81]|uniref:Mannosyltransferase n=1 Tax=Lepidopterella palustris CBS 459.81 TaxID=1314670 RepID=A0A8E2ECY4_9PEZI|nr:glycosyltransferase family 22 protein [Lepidopterella palustris CBS 459.81]